MMEEGLHFEKTNCICFCIRPNKPARPSDITYTIYFLLQTQTAIPACLTWICSHLWLSLWESLSCPYIWVHSCPGYVFPKHIFPCCYTCCPSLLLVVDCHLLTYPPTSVRHVHKE